MKTPGADTPTGEGSSGASAQLLLSPWLAEPWRQLQAVSMRHAHAVAVQAMPGLGADALIQAFIRARLCEGLAPGTLAGRSVSDLSRESTPTQPASEAHFSGTACGHCRSCRWLGRSTSLQHPDLRRLRPDADSDDEDANPAAGPDTEGQQPTAGSSRSEDSDSAVDTGDGRSGKAAPRRSREIRIESIRALASFLQTGSHRNRGKVIWIQPAEAMNFAAANALLKALEEPAAGCLFILSCENLSRLMPTIRSRCLQIRVRPPPPGRARDALAALHPHANQSFDFALGLSGHAPWSASQRIADHLLVEQAAWLHTLAHLPGDWFTQLAEAWAQQRPLSWFEVLERWSVDLLCSAHRLQSVYFPHLEQQAARRAAQSTLAALLALQASLRDVKRLLNHPLNPRLLAETALIAYARACSLRGW